MNQIPTIDDIKKAHERIKPLIHRTPVISSATINRLFNAEIFFKCENFQKVGAFKFRGATNALLSLPEEKLKYGVATHSSGNHAAAVALAARLKKIPAYIVMPETAPDVKKNAVAEYGARITFCKPTLDSRQSTLDRIVEETGAAPIHPYDNFDVICGQGTAAIELMEQRKALDMILCPIGGGGLQSGTAIAAKAINPGIEVIGTEPFNANDAYRSFKSGELIPSVNPQTIADGLLTSLSRLTFTIIRKYVDDIVTVHEANIKKALRFIIERMKIVVEPSSAVPFGAILENKIDISGKRVGIIISGGNVELNKIPFVLE